MACCSGQQRSNQILGGSYVSPPSAPQTCDYTINSLEALKLVVSDLELSVVQSQINMYAQDCNYLRAVVYPLFDIYNIDKDL